MRLPIIFFREFFIAKLACIFFDLLMNLFDVFVTIANLCETSAAAIGTHEWPFFTMRPYMVINFTK